MNPFSYVSAHSAESAVELVRDEGRYLAGGMDLLGEIKETIVAPKVLVNVKLLPGTTEIVPGLRWSIGANVTLTALATHPDVRRELPGLAAAAAEVGSPPIRNVATVGGNLAQHSRCRYYRHRDIRCRKKGGSTCYARRGESKYHSIFSASLCLSPCVSNLAVAFAALDAKVVVLRGRRTETLTVAELYADAWRTPAAHNALGKSDLILRVDLSPGTRRSAYKQVSENADFDWALVSCAAAAEIRGGILSRARIALGAVAPIPWQMEAVNKFLEGKPVNQETTEKAADMLLREASPAGDNAYKLPIAKALVRRTLVKLAEQS